MVLDFVGRRTLYGTFRFTTSSQEARQWLRYERGDGQVETWNWGEFLTSVHQATNLLLGNGIQYGDTINLHLPNNPAHIQLILAASYLGAVVVPTNPASTEEEHRFVVEDAECRLIFTSPDRVEQALRAAAASRTREVFVCDIGDSMSQRSVPSYEQALAQESPNPPRAHDGKSTSVVQLLYTSGTTSHPKGAMLTNANFLYGADVLRAATSLSSSDRHLVTLPVFHSGAQCHALWPSMVAGGSVALMPRFSASRFFAQAVQHEATMTALFAAPIRMLLNQPESSNDSSHLLRNVTYAQKLTLKERNDWDSRFEAPLQQLWGMTETCSLPVMSPLAGDRRLDAMGRPVLGYQIRIVERDGSECPPGEVGELLVRGVPGHDIMLGYHNRPAETQQVIVEDDYGAWLHSGDLVYCDSNDLIYFVDRLKDVIKIAGENVSSAEIEAVILSIPGIQDACVFGVADPVRDEQVVAVVVPEEADAISTAMVQETCSTRLPRWKVPQQVIFWSSLPRTSVGKVRKHSVRASFQNQSRDR